MRVRFFHLAAEGAVLPRFIEGEPAGLAEMLAERAAMRTEQKLGIDLPFAVVAAPFVGQLRPDDPQQLLQGRHSLAHLFNPVFDQGPHTVGTGHFQQIRLLVAGADELSEILVHDE